MLSKRADGYTEIGVIAIVSILVIVGVLAFIQHLQSTAPTNAPASTLYKQGDCIRNVDEPTCEKWEKCDHHVYKVLDVGKKSYRFLLVKYSGTDKKVGVSIGTTTLKDGDEGTEKVECTKELNDPKTLEYALGKTK